MRRSPSPRERVRVQDMSEGEKVMYTVWVGGSEMNSNLLTKAQAISIAGDWFNRGYKDVIVEEVK